MVKADQLVKSLLEIMNRHDVDQIHVMENNQKLIIIQNCKLWHTEGEKDESLKQNG